MTDAQATAGAVQSVERAFDILEIMASAGGSIGVSELADLAGLPLPTIHRPTRTLMNRDTPRTAVRRPAGDGGHGRHRRIHPSARRVRQPPLVRTVTTLLGCSYTSRQATYDLRRLKRKGLIAKLPGHHRYQLTPLGRASRIFDPPASAGCFRVS